MRAVPSIAIIAFTLVGFAGVAQAQDKADCNDLPYAQDLSNLALGTIVGPKVSFVANQSDKAECPAAGPACQRRAFVLRNNKVVFDKDATKAGFVCAAYIDGKGNQTSGWLPHASIKAATAPVNWIGTWKRYASAELDIKRKSATSVEVSGSATWGQGAATHEGDISADFDAGLALQGFAYDGENQVAYGKGDEALCGALMSQLGPYVFVVDNGNCGGANVSFTGLYMRR